MNFMNSKKMYKAASPRLSLAVQYVSTAPGLPPRAQWRRWCQAAMQRDLRMTLRIVDEPEGRELNKSYRGRDYATNVLTFVYDEQTPPGLPLSGEEILSGDVVICAPIVEKEARQQHKNLLAHYAHLAIHAVLHLQGYDHDNETEAAEMEALETRLMVKLRYPDPYQET